MLIRLTLAAALLATPALAADEAVTKEEACRYEGQVMAAVQKARLDRVKQADVPAHIAATNPSWPDSYNRAIPVMVDEIYNKHKRRELRKYDFGSAYEQQCLQIWEQRQEMLKAMQN